MNAISKASSPNKLGSGSRLSKYLQMGIDSEMHLPSSSSKTGIFPLGFFFKNSGDLCSRLAISQLTSSKDIFFSLANIFTLLGLGAWGKS